MLYNTQSSILPQHDRDSAVSSAGGLGVPCLYPRWGRPKRRKTLQRLNLRDLSSRSKQARNQQ